MTNTKIGGNGASDFGSYVWGKGGEQHSINADTNVIAVANDPISYKGGNCMKSIGGDLTTLGVPALLVTANHLYNPKRKSFSFKKNKRNSNGKRRKFFKGGEEGESGGTNVNNLLEKSNNLMNMMTPTTSPSVFYNETKINPDDIKENSNVPVFNGGNIKQTGAGIITDIALPAVLITANHLYGKRKSKKYGTKKYGKSKKNRGRSRRVSFRK